NNSVAPINQLLVFLRFCATGAHLVCIGDFSGIHLSTASRIVVRVGSTLARLYSKFVKMPLVDNINECQLKFYKKPRFPRVVGVIDCTHIKIESPAWLVNVVASWHGSIHDAIIFNNSKVKNEFENNLFRNSILLGDEGYNIRPYLLTPLQQPANRAEQLCNESRIRTRNITERLFGICKRRFPVLAYGCRLKLDTFFIIYVENNMRKSHLIPKMLNDLYVLCLIKYPTFHSLPATYCRKGIKIGGT
ncbi:hypothetical protein D910_12254, partial [Dendroctonus ponderosae]